MKKPDEDLQLQLERAEVVRKMRKEKINNCICVLCGKRVTRESFRDADALNEFKISGLCQACHDEYFKDTYIPE